jgi:hypothetical protein
MTDTLIRWTVRGIHQETLDMLGIVRQTSGGTYGELVNEAVAEWYDALPDADAPEDYDETI